MDKSTLINSHIFGIAKVVGKLLQSNLKLKNRHSINVNIDCNASLLARNLVVKYTMSNGVHAIEVSLTAFLLN